MSSGHPFNGKTINSKDLIAYKTESVLHIVASSVLLNIGALFRGMMYGQTDQQSWYTAFFWLWGFSVSNCP